MSEENKMMENRTRVQGRNLSVSTKHCIEIGDMIRHRYLPDAKEMLKAVIDKRKAVPFKRFNRNVGHRKGRIAAGRYPVKASRQILMLLNSLEKNAQFKGLSTNDIKIISFIANRATIPLHTGRRRREMKRTNVELYGEEIKIRKEAVKEGNRSAKEKDKAAIKEGDKKNISPDKKDHKKNTDKTADIQNIQKDKLDAEKSINRENKEPVNKKQDMNVESDTEDRRKRENKKDIERSEKKESKDSEDRDEKEKDEKENSTGDQK